MHHLISTLILNAVLLVAYMSAWFLVGRRRSRLDVADTAWGGGFILVALVDLVLQPPHTSAMILVALLVLVWGVRLATHIARRGWGKGQDPRYTELSAKWQGNFWLRAYVSVFMVQAALIWLVSLPIGWVANGTTSTGLSWLSILGGLVWLIGFIFESTADRQLAAFIHEPANRGKVLMSGLWRYSRHPNYFGELTQWWGIWLIALGVPHGLLAILGPLTITFLILKVSGIPPLEARYKGNADYEAYKHQTSVLIPLSPR